MYTLCMLKTIKKHIINRFFAHDNRQLILLRVLLVTIVVATVILIFKPPQERTQASKMVLNGKTIIPEKPFRIATTHICAAVLEGTISDVQNDSMVITFLKKQDGTKSFIPINPPVVHRVVNGACVPALPGCMDMSFEYCFTIDTDTIPAKVDYEVREMK